MVQMAGPRDHTAGPCEVAGLGRHFFSQVPVPALPGEHRAMKPFRSLGTGSRQLVSNGKKRGCSVAQGGLFGMRPDAALCIQVLPATRLLLLSQLARGWGSSRAQSLCTQAWPLELAGAGSKAPQGVLARGKQPSRAAPGQKIRLRVASRPLRGQRHRKQSTSQGPRELVRPVPELRQAAGHPAHTLHPALQSSAGPTAPCLLPQQPLAPQVRHSKICARAGHLQSRGRRYLLPQDVMLLETRPWLCRHPGPTVAGCSPGRTACRGHTAARSLCSAPGPACSTWAQAARRADGLAGGQGSSARDSARPPPSAQAQRLPDPHPRPAQPQHHWTLPCGSTGRQKAARKPASLLPMLRSRSSETPPGWLWQALGCPVVAL